MIPRAIEPELKALALQYPVITVTGPRQSGKTTLVQQAFPYLPYRNLETPDTRMLAETDPRSFLEELSEGGILDEIQRAPQLLSYIQVITDAKQKPGMFILTGSHQLSLHEAVSQSLAGRVAILKLLPLSTHELQNAGFELSIDEYLLKGFMPRIFKDSLNPTKAYRNYFETYIERDVRQLINIKDLSLFQRFMKLCAGRVGQIVNHSNFSNELGVSGHTIKNWFSILEASFVIIQLQPYFENFGKRMIKSPKLYFTEVGLATYLLGVENITQISHDRLRGELFENLVLLELLKARLNKGLDPQLYFYRDSQQNEVDIVFKSAHSLIPIEVKISKTFVPEFLKGLKYFMNLALNRSPSGFLLYSGTVEQKLGDIQLLNFKNAADILDRI